MIYVSAVRKRESPFLGFGRESPLKVNEAGKRR
jgi:hypothetical protein